MSEGFLSPLQIEVDGIYSMIFYSVSNIVSNRCFVE